MSFGTCNVYGGFGTFSTDIFQVSSTVFPLKESNQIITVLETLSSAQNTFSASGFGRGSPVQVSTPDRLAVKQF